MEPIFENRYRSTHKMMAEFFRKYRTGPRPAVVVAVLGFYVFFVWMCYARGILAKMALTIVVMGIFFGGIYFLPDYYAWKSLRNSQKHNDGILPETIVIFEDTIEVHEGIIRISLEYRRIVQVVRLKYSYMLMLGKRNGVILDPNGFTKGTFEEFKQFLGTKRPDLVIPE